MKVAIIGGGGLVGSCAGFALQAGRIVREIALVDVNRELAEGQALDLMHASALVADQKIYAGGTEQAADSDVVLLTAGLRRKPDESRLDLINRNVELFRGILADVKRHGLKKDALVFVVSNPVDVLTYLAVKELPLGPERVFGLGTMLDTTRLRGILAQRLGVPAAQVAGLPLEKWPGATPALIQDAERRTRASGAEVIKKKTGAGFAVGVSIAEVVHAIALDRRLVLPVSTLQTGAY